MCYFSLCVGQRTQDLPRKKTQTQQVKKKPQKAKNQQKKKPLEKRHFSLSVKCITQGHHYALMVCIKLTSPKTNL